MKVQINRTRMAMAGNHFAYDVIVPVSEVNEADHSYFISRDGINYVPFEAATMPAHIRQMSAGFDKHDQAEAHRKAMKAEMLQLAKSQFPELSAVTAWPELWINLPEYFGGHAERSTEYTSEVSA